MGGPNFDDVISAGSFKSVDDLKRVLLDPNLEPIALYLGLLKLATLNQTSCQEVVSERIRLASQAAELRNQLDLHVLAEFKPIFAGLDEKFERSRYIYGKLSISHMLNAPGVQRVWFNRVHRAILNIDDETLSKYAHSVLSFSNLTYENTVMAKYILRFDRDALPLTFWVLACMKCAMGYPEQNGQYLGSWLHSFTNNPVVADQLYPVLEKLIGIEYSPNLSPYEILEFVFNRLKASGDIELMQALSSSMMDLEALGIEDFSKFNLEPRTFDIDANSSHESLKAAREAQRKF